MRTRLAFLASAIFCVAAVSAHADPFTSVVVYGDSLSDNGNVYAQTGYFPPFPYVGGRFSNGPVAVEQLANLLGGLPLYDYAFGGATTGSTNVLNGAYPGVSGLPGVAQEIQDHVLPASQLASSLTVLWAGANDFDALSNPTDADAVAAAQTAVGNLLSSIATLRNEGAVSILVPDLPDLGTVPRYLANGEGAQATLYSNTFNAGLRAGLPAGATLFDTDAAFRAILADTAAFSHGVTPCLNNPAAYPSCSGYIFFDDLHPTTAADTILAQDFAAAVTPAAAATPEPGSLLLLCTGLTGTYAMFRRRRGFASQAN